MTAPAQFAGTAEMTRTARCHKHGEYISLGHRVEWSKEPYWDGCNQCAEDRRSEDEHREEKRKQRIFATTLAAVGIPLRFKRFNGKILDNFEVADATHAKALEVARSYVAKFDEHLAVGRCVVIIGPVGTGKTHLALGIAEAIFRGSYWLEPGSDHASCRRVRYTGQGDLIREMREAWRRDSTETESNSLGRLAKLDLLIIDEIGVGFGSEAEQVQLTELIDARYRDVKPTVIVSNLTLPEVEECLGDRAYDRLWEAAPIVVRLTGESYRRHAGTYGHAERNSFARLETKDEHQQQ